MKRRTVRRSPTSMAHTLRLVPYSTDWPARFEAEAARLRSALGGVRPDSGWRHPEPLRLKRRVRPGVLFPWRRADIGSGLMPVPPPSVGAVLNVRATHIDADCLSWIT